MNFDIKNFKKMPLIKCYIQPSYTQKIRYGYICCDIYNQKNSSVEKLKFFPRDGTRSYDLVRFGMQECIKHCKSKYPSERIIIFVRSKARK